MDTKKYYRCVILVIASNENNTYKNARSVWKKYMNSNPSVKVLFVYGKLHNNLVDQDLSDIIFNDLEESLTSNTILLKTLRAMYIINKYFKYDYFIRTNISTFWNFNYIERLLEKCPKEKCYAGGHNLSPYYINENECTVKPVYSGVCIIITPDIATIILNNISKINYNIPDDISIGLFMSNIECNTYDVINRAYYENYNMLDDEAINMQINKDLDNCIYYRVKNNNNREHTDLMIYNILLNKIYNM
jgi:hypothetical protein